MDDDLQRTTGSGLARLVDALSRAGFEPDAVKGVARCPAHDDHHPSLHYRQGARGVVLICRSAGCSTSEIAIAIGLRVEQLFDDWAPRGSRARPTLRLTPPEPEQQPELLVEIPEHEVWRPGERVVYLRSDGSTRDCLASAVHVYRTAEGRAHHLVIRIEPTHARKWFLPLRWDDRVWRAGAQPKPATIYGLERLAGCGLRQVLVVEGEKAADVVNRRDLPGLLAVTWPGGCGAVTHADWSPLKGHNLVVWPDADDAGRSAMRSLAGILAPIAASLKWIETQDLPRGFDAADVSPDEDLLAWLRPRVQEVVS